MGECKLPGRPRTSKCDNEHIRLSCQRSPQISLARQKLQPVVPNTTFQNVLHKRLTWHLYRIKILREVKNTNFLNKSSVYGFDAECGL